MIAAIGPSGEQTYIPIGAVKANWFDFGFDRIIVPRCGTSRGPSIAGGIGILIDFGPVGDHRPGPAISSPTVGVAVFKVIAEQSPPW